MNNNNNDSINNNDMLNKKIVINHIEKKQKQRQLTMTNKVNKMKTKRLLRVISCSLNKENKNFLKQQKFVVR